ncbi:uncharacterized protein LOC143422064 [Xylocopa sonorina]|uniref:uncharacterized protein LOC143422064 n=1 Tax=Xylocopa sonorina TaxID=1818115 RepID=UPI00403AEF36
MESIETAPKRTRRTLKRISATHNFIYEFNPFGNPALPCNNATTAKGGRNLPNIGQGDSSLRSTNGKQNSNHAQMQSAAALPKLQPRNDTATGSLERYENVSSCGRNGNFPNIKNQETTDQRLTKDRGKRNLVSDIDREVEKVKSDWRVMREGGGWTQNKNFANTRTRKLYDTLEKMTQEIDKIQKSYLDPKSNQYLDRGAMKALDPPPLSLEEKTERIQNMLFPKETKQVVDDTLKNAPNDTLKSSLLNGISSKDRKFEKKYLLSNIQSKNVKNGTKLIRNMSSNFNKPDTNPNRRMTLKKINSNIEQYLDEYVNEAERYFVNKEDSKTKELDVLSDDVEDMMRKLNINSFDIYDIGDECEENPSLLSVERKKNIKKQNSTQTMIEQGSTKVKEAAAINLSSNPDHLAQWDTLNSNTSIQTNANVAHGENAFIEIGLQALNNNFSRNAFSRVLQSEYLKKDTSLKPM